MDAGTPAPVTLDRKLAHLSRPNRYAGGTRGVETVETHLSYVFLTEDTVYKLKKPVGNLATLEARRLNCEEEVRLNRRLAPAVYLGVVALARDASGLVLEGGGEPVEWLVKMRRLPRALMLDAVLAEDRLREHDVERFVTALTAFYRTALRSPLSPAEYLARFERRIRDNREALSNARYALDTALVGTVTDAQLAFVATSAALLGPRGRVLVDGHGDLRPEHVCLSDPPVFIDCLEFDRDLRIVDPADEIGYLAMECTYSGHADAAARVLAAWRASSGDCADASLVRFYQSCRAVTRARLAACHLDDTVVNGGRARWIDHARRYLALAAELILNPAGAPAPTRLRACA